MIGHILNKQLAVGRLGGARVHIGGNLGGSLLGELDKIGRDDWVVLELSSFMLEDMAGDRWSPHVAVVTNLNPNHLDRHGTLEAYARAKQAILEHQTPDDHAVIGPVPRGFFHPRTTNVHWVETWDNVVGKLPIKLLIPGEHNLLNAHAAIEAALCAGLDRHESAAALGDFPGLPHRLQFVCEYGGTSGTAGASGTSGGVRFFNDSKATTPPGRGIGHPQLPFGLRPRHSGRVRQGQRSGPIGALRGRLLPGHLYHRRHRQHHRRRRHRRRTATGRHSGPLCHARPCRGPNRAAAPRQRRRVAQSRLRILGPV